MREIAEFIILENLFIYLITWYLLCILFFREIEFGNFLSTGNRRDRDGNREGGDRQFGNRDGGNRRGGGGHHRGGDRDQNGPGKFGERIKFSDRGYSNNKFGDNKNNDRKPRTFASNNRE